MSVAYIRTYELEYDVVPSEQQLKAINTLLMQENLPAIDRWDTEVLEDKYGLVDKVTKTETYAVGWEIDGEHVDKVLFFEYQSRADSVVDDLSSVGIDATITHSKSEETKTVEQTLRGEKLILLRKLSDYRLNGYGDKPLVYENEVELSASLITSYRNTKLRFTSQWMTDKVARKAQIESMVVDTPLNDMAEIQHIVETILHTVTEYDVSEAEINCHFDAKTESRSECTPDIINRVKEAKKLLEVEQ